MDTDLLLDTLKGANQKLKDRQAEIRELKSELRRQEEAGDPLKWKREAEKLSAEVEKLKDDLACQEEVNKLLEADLKGLRKKLRRKRKKASRSSGQGSAEAEEVKRSSTRRTEEPSVPTLGKRKQGGWSLYKIPGKKRLKKIQADEGHSGPITPEVEGKSSNEGARCTFCLDAVERVSSQQAFSSTRFPLCHHVFCDRCCLEILDAAMAKKEPPVCPKCETPGEDNED